VSRARYVIEAKSPKDFFRQLPIAGLITALERKQALYRMKGWSGAEAEIRMYIEYLRGDDPEIRQQGAACALAWADTMPGHDPELKQLMLRVAQVLTESSARNFIMKAIQARRRDWVIVYRDTNNELRRCISGGVTSDAAVKGLADALERSGTPRLADVLAVRPYRAPVGESAKDFIMKSVPPPIDWGEPDVLRDEQGRAYRYRWDALKPRVILFMNVEGGGNYSVSSLRYGVDPFTKSIRDPESDSYVWPAITITHAMFKAKALAEKVLMGKLREDQPRAARDFIVGTLSQTVSQELERLIKHYEGAGFHATAHKLRTLQHLHNHPEDTKYLEKLALKYSYQHHNDPISWIDAWAQHLAPYLDRHGHDHAHRVHAFLLKLKREFQIRRVSQTEGTTRDFMMSVAPPFWFKEFYNAYVEAALWSSMDDDGNSLDSAVYEDAEIAPETVEKMKADCTQFVLQNRDDIVDDVTQAGHDFWLTRNGHGCGFNDGDWPDEVAERLYRASKAFGQVDLYVGDDDGYIYQQP
jgi:hypothetical protein